MLINVIVFYDQIPWYDSRAPSEVCYIRSPDIQAQLNINHQCKHIHDRKCCHVRSISPGWTTPSNPDIILCETRSRILSTCLAHSMGFRVDRRVDWYTVPDERLRSAPKTLRSLKPRPPERDEAPTEEPCLMNAWLVRVQLNRIRTSTPPSDRFAKSGLQVKVGQTFVGIIVGLYDC